MWAAADNHADVIKLLVEKGANVNATATVLEFPKVKVDPATMVVTALPRGGLTPLMYAARQGSLAAARALSEAGADLNRTDPDGTSAMVIAVINAHYDVAALLAEKGADPEIGDTSGMAALYAAVDMHTLDPLVNRPPPRTTGELDAVDFVKALLARKVNPNATLKAPLLARQHNAGDGALGAGATPLMRAAKNGDVTLMRVLIEHGADPNRTTRAGMTPLLFAMGPGRRKSAADTIEAVRICLDGGADVNAANQNGETPLHVAVGQGDALVRLLAEKGARLDAKDQLGRTPLDVAIGGASVPGGRAGRGGRGGGGPRESTVTLLRELMDQRAARGAALPQ
jgi:ankyrin repeat protein